MASSQNENALADDWQTDGSGVWTARNDHRESSKQACRSDFVKNASRKVVPALLLLCYFVKATMDSP